MNVRRLLHQLSVNEATSKEVMFEINCTPGRHHAAQCRSRVTCFHCKKKHHSSICDTLEKPPLNQIPGQAAMTATHEEQKV
jgi:hypothetical protein